MESTFNLKVKDHTIKYKLMSANGEKGEVKPYHTVTATHENNTVWYKGIFQMLI